MAGSSVTDAPCETGRALGKYELLRLIARGGMGEVHLARLPGELGFEKLLVVKTIRPELAARPRFVELFAAEAKIAVGLSHPNIAPIYELGRAEDGTLYAAMGWVDGPSVQVLLDRLRGRGHTLDFAATLFIARELLEGLAHAHAADPDHARPPVVHRDVTPRNVLVDRSGRVQLVDFGIAKPASIEDGAGLGAGSVGYMAPEQARGEAVDPRADVFSVGCVVYELLTNARAFTGEGVWLSPDLDPIPSALRPILARALALDPLERYADADALRRELAPILATEAPAFGSRDLAAIIRELFPGADWDPSTSTAADADAHQTPATQAGAVLEPFATRLPAPNDGPITEPDDITGAVPVLPPELSELANDPGPDPGPALDPPVETGAPVSEPRRKRAFGLVAALALVAVAGLAVVLGLASRTDPSAPASNSNPDPNPNPNPNPNATDPGPGSDSAADPSNPETAGPREPSSAQAEPASITATIIELDLSPTDPKIDVAFEVEVDGQRLPGPPYRVELGDRARELVVRLDGHRSRTLVLDPHHPPASPLPVQLEALEPGLLSVVAPGVAWAEVWLDGVKIGTTPLADAPVPEGRHRLEVRCTADVCGEARLLLDQSVRIRAKRGTKVSAG